MPGDPAGGAGAGQAAGDRPPAQQVLPQDLTMEAGAETFMRRAIALSREKSAAGEGGPFGAVVVRDGTIIGEGWNQVVGTNDPTAHAEVVAIRRACAHRG